MVEGTQDIWHVGQRLFVLEDESQALTIEDVSRPELAHRFIRSSMDPPTHGFSRSAYWVRFSYLEKNLAPERSWLLAVMNASLEQVDVYFQRPDGSFDVRRGGARVPWAMREVAHRFHAFHLPEAHTEPVTVYIRVQTSSLMTLPVEILTGDKLTRVAASLLVPWWIYAGILASMVLFNTVLYVFLRDRAYLYYVLYIVFFGHFILLRFSGIGHEYLPDAGPWLVRIPQSLAHLGGLCVVLFARSFLHTSRTVPGLDRLLRAWLAVCGISTVLAAFIPVRVSLLIGNTLALVSGPLLLGVSIAVWRRGFGPARFFLAGWSSLCLAVVLVPLSNQGWLPTNIVTRHLVMVGSALEMILFALALANRINEAKKESEAARRQALEGEIHRLRNIELRQANEEILRKQEQLVQAEKLASMGQLAAGVAHEIKNPLNFVNNFSLSLVEMTDELLQEFKSLPADKQADLAMLANDCRQTAQKIAEHGKRADGIVRSMLEHATVRPGVRSRVDLNRFIEEHIGLLLQDAKGQRLGVPVSVERALEPGLPPVEIIPQELGRALLNLLSNALHAVSEQHKKGLGGYAPAVCVSTLRQEDRVEIRIQDNGTGIPAAVRERIFEPFFTTKRPGEGLGLGLSLSHGIITKRHEGTLEFDSTENDGTTFIITLPFNARVRP
ncbi:MAG TPA: 7TM diverse intracellular signaling domain-containing protein [Archangium sp.]|uniref:sensor histidine kinase n=1 Tax=Archangium sp. TaxID=1872627 RepID=UPI002E2FD96C|nr:7TM diverse intracellular signaling domain-containing protein [Archangium sp.]HEX5750207.1 7TM diverse intracellular signaling domain-containing protein [Archangium sp.]